MTTDNITVQFRNYWYTPRIDPPLPAHWQLSESERTTLESVLWRLLSAGESDPGRYEYYFLRVPSLKDAAERDRGQEVSEYIHRLIISRRAFIESLGGVPATPLNRAFNDLEREGISTHPQAGQGGVPYEAPNDGRTWYGYAVLGTEEANEIINQGQTRLNCGAFISGEEIDEMLDIEYNHTNSAVIRARIIPVLERHGVQVEWDGTYLELPLIKNVEFFASP